MKPEPPESTTLSRREALLRMAWAAGGLFATPVFGGAMVGCSSDNSTVASTFSTAQRELLAAVVDHILPPTDTPGASAVGVPEFIEAVWEACFSEAGQQQFLAGLATVDAQAQEDHQQPFLACTPAQQQALVVQLDAAAFQPSPAPSTPATPQIAAPDSTEWVWGEPADTGPPPPFWRTLKRLTLLGYYSSEPGATEELRYEAVPGRYDGCIPFAEVGRTWA